MEGLWLNDLLKTHTQFLLTLCRLYSNLTLLRPSLPVDNTVVFAENILEVPESQNRPIRARLA